MSADHHEPQMEELIPGYALGALDSAERRIFEQHLRACPTCQELLDEYRAVSEALLEIPRPIEPRPMLRQSLAAAIPVPSVRPQGATSWRRAAFAMAAVFLIMVAANLFLVNQVLQVRSALSSLQNDIDTNQTALAINSYPTTRVASLDGDQAFGTFVFDPTRTIGVLYAWGLPFDSGEVEYAAWLTTPSGDRVNVGRFQPDGSGRFTMVVLRSTEPISGFEGVGVSRIAGDDGELHGDPLLFASLEADG